MKRIFQFCIVMLVALPAIGKPLSINFETMMSKSKSIVIGTYLGEYVAGKTSVSYTHLTLPTKRIV